MTDTIAVQGPAADAALPARILWAVADHQKIEDAERFARHLSTTVRGIDGGRHFTPEDHSDVVEQEIRGLAAEVAAR